MVSCAWLTDIVWEYFTATLSNRERVIPFLYRKVAQATYTCMWYSSISNTEPHSLLHQRSVSPLKNDKNN